jgi:hypothetical protein
MNENNITQTAIESERKAVDAVINILLLFILGLAAFAAGYFLAMHEVAALAGAI